MAGGGNIRIIDEGDVTKGGRGARVRDHRVWVEATIVGGVTITPPLNVRLQDGVGADVVTVLKDSDVASPGGQAAGIMAASLVKTPSVVGIVSVNDLAFLRSDLAGNLAVTNFMRDSVITANICSVVCTGDDSLELSPCGILPMFETNDSPSALSASFSHAFISTAGRILVETKEVGVTTLAFSGSTRGRPIQITGTTTGAAVTVHTATTTAGELDRMFIDLTNTSTSAVIVTLEFGTTGIGNEIYVIVPAKETVVAIKASVIGGAATDVIKAYASVASVVNVVGRVERLAA